MEELIFAPFMSKTNSSVWYLAVKNLSMNSHLGISELDLWNSSKSPSIAFRSRVEQINTNITYQFVVLLPNNDKFKWGPDSLIAGGRLNKASISNMTSLNYIASFTFISLHKILKLQKIPNQLCGQTGSEDIFLIKNLKNGLT